MAGLIFVVKAHLRGVRVTSDAGLRMSRSLRGPDVMVVDHRLAEKWVTDPPVLVAEVLSRSTRAEDLLRKSREYAEAGVGQYWTVDPDARLIEVSELEDGEWRLLVRVDEALPSAEVRVGEYGVVPLDLADVLDG